MGHRRTIRGLRPRTDLEILDSSDIDVLRAIEAGEVSRPGKGVAPVFMVAEVLINLKNLAREDLCTSPIGGLPVLEPRGRRLLQVEHGELPRPLPE